jgi:hypothetical protein
MAATASPFPWPDSKRAAKPALASALLFYDFAKVNDAQFTALDSELEKPMGQISGFWLTWYYFGCPAVYGTLPVTPTVANLGSIHDECIRHSSN